MGAPSEYYVDPGGGSDVTGDGTIGTPWATVQHALDNITRDSTNGDRINIKAGTDDSLSSSLNDTTYGSATVDAPLIFQGYTSSAGDGGIGGINGGGSVSLTASADFPNAIWRDLHLHNTGSNHIFNQVGDRCKFINCEIDNTTQRGVFGQDDFIFINCHFHNIGLGGIFCENAHISYCYFKDDGANTMANAIALNNVGIGPCFVYNNIISLSGGGNGIWLENYHISVVHNSILQTGTGGNGIYLVGSTAGYQNISIQNNLVEGFDKGIYVSSDNSNSLLVIQGNAVYDIDTTDYDIGDVQLTEDNESLGSSPFTKSGSDTYANRRTYYDPQNIGNVFSPLGSVMTAKGAIQPAS